MPVRGKPDKRPRLTITRKDLRRGAALTAALMLTACAGRNPAHSEAERVTPAMWAEAQAHAARLSDLSQDLGGSRALIVHVPFAELGHVTDHAAQAAAYDREHNVVLFRDDRPWQSDRGHHAGIVIHEAVHTQQPDDMPKRLSRAAGLCRAGRMAARAGRASARRRDGAPWVALSVLGAP